MHHPRPETGRGVTRVSALRLNGHALRARGGGGAVVTGPQNTMRRTATKAAPIGALCIDCHMLSSLCLRAAHPLRWSPALWHPPARPFSRSIIVDLFHGQIKSAVACGQYALCLAPGAPRPLLPDHRGSVQCGPQSPPLPPMRIPNQRMSGDSPETPPSDAQPAAILPLALRDHRCSMGPVAILAPTPPLPPPGSGNTDGAGITRPFCAPPSTAAVLATAPPTHSALFPGPKHWWGCRGTIAPPPPPRPGGFCKMHTELVDERERNWERPRLFLAVLSGLQGASFLEGRCVGLCLSPSARSNSMTHVWRT